MSRRPQLVPVRDLDTGEVIDGLGVVVPGDPATKRDKASPTIHRSWGGLDFTFAASLDLTSTQWRILFTLAGRINRETGAATITIAALARRLRLNYKTVHAAITGLKQLALVTGAGGDWYITPELLSRLGLREWDEATYLHRQRTADREAL